MSNRASWTVQSTRHVYDNPWISLDHHDVIAPTGKPGVYGKVHFKSLAIGVLPIDDQGYTWLVGQNRFCFDSWSWELPEGGGDLNGDPLDAAKRELAEETGLKATEYLPLFQDVHLSNSVTDERAFAFIATGLLPCNDHLPDDTEQLEIMHLPLESVFSMIESEEITDMFTLAMFWRAYHLAMTGRLPDGIAYHFRSR